MRVKQDVNKTFRTRRIIIILKEIHSDLKQKSRANVYYGDDAMQWKCKCMLKCIE